MGATLDGRVGPSGAVFEAKFMLQWSFSKEAAARKKWPSCSVTCGSSRPEARSSRSRGGRVDKTRFRNCFSRGRLRKICRAVSANQNALTSFGMRGLMLLCEWTPL
jgi:hypothetical protein